MSLEVCVHRVSQSWMVAQTRVIQCALGRA